MTMETNHTMTHASLFSGIGGAEIAAAWMGWDNLFHCELNPFGRKVLEYWFPNAKSYGDITKTDFTPWHGQIDVLTAGFPCQPFSLAGQRKGAEDDRYLWPQVMRVVRETRPAWVVGENVAGILTMVQPGCEADVASQATLFGEDNLCRTEQQYVIETICQDLESAGYSVQPFDIPACAVGAPHRRDRVWIVAHAASIGRDKGGLHHERVEEEQGECEFEPADCPQNQWRHFPTQSPVCCRDDGLSLGLAGITFPRWRAEAVKALGNAWVPQVAYEIFRAIEAANAEFEI